MTFTRDPVRMLGTLTGRYFAARCTVSATRVTLVGTRLTKDCRYSIDWVSQTLPFGTYKLLVEGRIVNMVHSKAGWREIQNPAEPT